MSLCFQSLGAFVHCLKPKVARSARYTVDVDGVCGLRQRVLDGFDNVPQLGHHEHTAREMVEANGLLSTFKDGIVVERPLEVNQAVHRPIHIGACAKTQVWTGQ